MSILPAILTKDTIGAKDVAIEAFGGGIVTLAPLVVLAEIRPVY